MAGFNVVHLSHNVNSRGADHSRTIKVGSRSAQVNY
jgi:hypothetical protein